MKIDNIENDLWTLIDCMPGSYKLHVCPKRLGTALITDLCERYFTKSGDELDTSNIVVKPISKIIVDLPGMCMTDRPYELIKLDTLSISIPSQDFQMIFDHALNLKMREFSNGEKYFKLHGWNVCVVFTLKQFELLIEAMGDMLSTANLKADIANEEFSDRIDEINKKSNSIKVLSYRNSNNINVPKIKTDGSNN